MMRMKTGFIARIRESSVGTATEIEEDIEWEKRPGGMLVQKRAAKPDSAPPPDLRIRVAYGALRYAVSVNSQSTIGELKKAVAAETGLRPEEQRVIVRGRDRGNGEYLDVCGVKQGSKVVVMEDERSREIRAAEMRRKAKMHNLHRAISDASAEVDRLAKQVDFVKESISGGAKVAEIQINVLTEMLMGQALKLDGISAQGDAAVARCSQAQVGCREKECSGAWKLWMY